MSFLAELWVSRAASQAGQQGQYCGEYHRSAWNLHVIYMLTHVQALYNLDDNGGVKVHTYR